MRPFFWGLAGLSLIAPTAWGTPLHSDIGLDAPTTTLYFNDARLSQNAPVNDAYRDQGVVFENLNYYSSNVFGLPYGLLLNWAEFSSPFDLASSVPVNPLAFRLQFLAPVTEAALSLWGYFETDPDTGAPLDDLTSILIETRLNGALVETTSLSAEFQEWTGFRDSLFDEVSIRFADQPMQVLLFGLQFGVAEAQISEPAPLWLVSLGLLGVGLREKNRYASSRG